ncbi:MAG TPA: hypothetical protein P5534_18225 [Candidatus Paceibacterota bacterium]|nr:hypothetical protein [Candidatus Paceibacterota bacterium]
MRTKTALLTAALGLVGAATVSAQVYSVNVVGYVNSELKAGWNLIANPLDNTAANGNTVGVLFGTALPDGSAVYKFDNANGKYLDTVSYTSLFGWSDPALTLVPGEGAFVFVEGSAAVTITFVGDVKQGTLTTPLAAGFNMVSSQVPQAGLLVTDLGYVAVDGDTVYQHNRGAGYKDGNTFTGLFGWSGGEPTIGVGEAFWIQKEAAGAWNRTFSVQ